MVLSAPASGNAAQHGPWLKALLIRLTSADVVVPAAAAPLPGELLQMLDQRLQERGQVADPEGFGNKFVDTLKGFILKRVSCHWVIAWHESLVGSVCSDTANTKAFNA